MTGSLGLKWAARKSLAAAALGILGVMALSLATATQAQAKSGGGGVVTFAEQPASPPNYIFPLESGAYFTFANGQFVPEMYLPLYWFGDHGKPVLNKGLSIAYPPTFSNNNTTVTIRMKHWRWSDGQPITARDVTFWMNMLSAATDPNAPVIGSSSAPGPGWGAQVTGGFPENVVSYTAAGTYKVTFQLNASYNPTWFLYNELSQIYPVPQSAWDKLGPGEAVGSYDVSAQSRRTLSGTSPAQYVPVTPGTGSTGALGVAQFLNSQSQDLSTYDTNPLWKVVDGPFRLASFSSSGFVKLVPNSKYSGAPKPKVSAFEELPFASAAAEFNVLRSGGVTIGYIPAQDLKAKGQLLRSGYAYSPWYAFGFNGLDFNFTNPQVGPVFKQLYFRQAFQSLVNQAQYINDFMSGVGTPSNGPVPTYPPHNPDESSLESGRQVYPYDPSKAVSLLKAHGWAVLPGGATYCARPGSSSADCGTGIPAREHLSFTLLYPSGSPELTDQMVDMQSTMKAKAGIELSLNESPVNQVTSIESAGCTYASPCSDWQLSTEANTGVSWVYLPDYFPTGGEIFLPGSNSNHGDYGSAEATRLINETHTAATSSAETKALYSYENYIARQLPEAWMPTSPYQLTMYKKSLKGFVPQGIFTEIYPQAYSLG